MDKPNLYKVRTGTHNENTIHVPKTSNGWYSLEVKDDGTLVFKPVVV